MGKQEPKPMRTETVTVRLTPEAKRLAEDLALGKHRTLSNWINMLVEVAIVSALEGNKNAEHE